MPVLALHPPFDTVLGMVLDILHALYIGVVKALLSLWFSSSKSHEEYSIYSQVPRC